LTSPATTVEESMADEPAWKLAPAPAIFQKAAPPAFSPASTGGIG
jgi:hypothetical protein